MHHAALVDAEEVAGTPVALLDDHAPEVHLLAGAIKKNKKRFSGELPSLAEPLK